MSLFSISIEIYSYQPQLLKKKKKHKNYKNILSSKPNQKKKHLKKWTIIRAQ